MFIYYSLLIIMETNFFGSQEEEASRLVAVLLGQVQEVLSVLLLRVRVVYDYAFARLNVLLRHFVAFLLCFEGVAVDSLIVGHIVVPEGRFACAGTATENDHLFLHELHILIVGISENIAFNWNLFGIKASKFDYCCII